MLGTDPFINGTFKARILAFNRDENSYFLKSESSIEIRKETRELEYM